VIFVYCALDYMYTVSQKNNTLFISDMQLKCVHFTLAYRLHCFIYEACVTRNICRWFS